MEDENIYSLHCFLNGNNTLKQRWFSCILFFTRLFRYSHLSCGDGWERVYGGVWVENVLQC